jgi:hypothetical protein
MIVSARFGGNRLASNAALTLMGRMSCLGGRYPLVNRSIRDGFLRFHLRDSDAVPMHLTKTRTDIVQENDRDNLMAIVGGAGGLQ